MAGTDVQKQLEEAAAERSGIAKALLAIQKTLDLMAPAVANMEPAVAKMEPALASLEPVVQDLAAWRPGVDTAMGQFRVDLGEIRAELEKMARHTAGRDKMAEASSSAVADAPELEGHRSGDGYGLDGHRRASIPRELVGGGGLSSPHRSRPTVRSALLLLRHRFPHHRCWILAVGLVIEVRIISM